MNINALQDELFLNGSTLCVLDNNFNNFKKITYLHFSLSVMIENESCNDFDGSLLNRYEQITEEKIYKNYQCMIQKFDSEVVLYIYVYCFSNMMRITFSPILLQNEEVSVFFDTYLNFSNHVVETSQVVDCSYIHSPNFTNSLQHQLSIKNSFLVIPSPIDSKLYKQLPLSILSKINPIHRHLKNKEGVFCLRKVRGDWKVAYTSEAIAQKLGILFDSIYFLDAPIQELH